MAKRHIQGAEAIQFYTNYGASLQNQLKAVTAIRENVRSIIEIYGLVPTMPEAVAQAELEPLAELQAKQLTLIAAYEASTITLGAPSAKSQTKQDTPTDGTQEQAAGTQDQAPGTQPPTAKNQNGNSGNGAPSEVTNTTTVPANNGGIIINATSLNNAEPSAAGGGAPPAKTTVVPPKQTTPQKTQPAAPATTPKKSGGTGTGGTTTAPSKQNKNPVTTPPPASGDPSKNNPSGSNLGNTTSPGILTGRILVDATGKPINQAVVITYCDKGDSKFTTRTNEAGQYVFTNLPSGACL